MDLYNLLNYLQSTGFVEFFLPFILLFSLMYMALSLIEFGPSDKKEHLPNNLRTIIAAAFAILMLTPHVTMPGSRFDIVPMMVFFLSDVALLIVGILSVLLLMGLAGKDVTEEYGTYFTIAAIVFVIYLFLTYLEMIPPLSSISQDTISAAISLIIFVLIVKFVTGGEPDKKKKNKKKEG